MYPMITSSVTFPELSTKYPRPHGRRPQHSFLSVAVLLHQLPRTLPLEPLHQVARRHVRRAGEEQADVVDADVPLEDLDLQLRTDRSHDLADPEDDVTPQD